MKLFMRNIAPIWLSISGPLDREKWKDESEGMDFTEAPPEAPDLNLEPFQVEEPTALLLILKYLAIALLAGLLVYLIVRIIAKRKGQQGEAESTVKPIIDNEDGPSATSPMDVLWNAYRESKEAGDYREAVRLLHQIVIKHLDLLGKLKASNGKTNREYLNEFSWSEKSMELAQLTVLHEFIWYGGKSVRKTDFDLAEPKFLNFIESIQNG
jgi:hypothetical protein